MNAPDTSSPSARRPLLRRWRAAGLVAAVAGALALGACSHGGHRGWQDGPASAQMDPERAARFAERMADRIVSAVDGTPEQRQRIQAIAQATVSDLAPLREQARAARRDGAAIDPAARQPRSWRELFQFLRPLLAARGTTGAVGARAAAQPDPTVEPRP